MNREAVREAFPASWYVSIAGKDKVSIWLVAPCLMHGRERREKERHADPVDAWKDLWIMLNSTRRINGRGGGVDSGGVIGILVLR